MRIVPRTRAWRFSSARPGSRPANGSAEHLEERRVRGLDRDRERADPELLGQRLGVGDAARAREARRHEHADHVVGAERVGRDRGDERRVDAAREPDHHVGEAVLGDVVAGADHERLVHLVHRLERRLDPRRRRSARRAGPAHQHLGERGRSSTAARVEGAAPERGPDVDVDDEQVLGELRAARDELPALVEQHRRAVEDELVLAADEVHVDERHRRVGGTRREHRLALAQAARVVRRRVDVDDELGAGRGLREDRARRAPRVLADRDRRRARRRRRTAGRRWATARSSAPRRTPRSSAGGACGRCPAPRRARARPPRCRGRGRPRGSRRRAAIAPVRAATLSSHSRAWATNAGRSSRSSGG